MKPEGATIPSLDGIRAIAVGLVFFAHSGLEHLVPGALGVTIFFVLSGFLITTLMRVEHARTGRIHFGRFYLRRVLRLMPPLFIVAFAALLLTQAGLAEGGFSLAGLLSVLFYVGNYFVIATDFHGIPAGIGVVWSLAVEEHYYLFYPPLAAVLLRLARARTSVIVLGTLCAAVLAWRCWLVGQGASDAYITMATDTRIDAILFGCLLALLRNPWLEPAPQRRPLAEAGLALGCVAVLLGSLAWRDEFFRMTLRYTVQSMAIVPLLYLAVVRARQWPYRWLNARPMVYIGVVSYTVYLSHQVILFMVEYHAPQLGWAPTLALTALLTLCVCEAMRRWVEEPCAQLRRRLHRDASAAPHAANTLAARQGVSA